MTSTPTPAQVLEQIELLEKQAKKASPYLWPEECLEIAASLRALAAQLAEQQQELERRWIPVSERLPEGWTEVLFCLEGRKVVCGFRAAGKWHMSDERPINVQTVITHWMPLPAPPAQAGAGGE